MPKNMHMNDLEIYRVVITTTSNGRTFINAYGAYHSVAAARGVIAYERKHAWRRETFYAEIQKSPVEWETVETQS